MEKWVYAVLIVVALWMWYNNFKIWENLTNTSNSSVVVPILQKMPVSQLTAAFPLVSTDVYKNLQLGFTYLTYQQQQDRAYFLSTLMAQNTSLNAQTNVLTKFTVKQTNAFNLLQGFVIEQVNEYPKYWQTTIQSNAKNMSYSINYMNIINFVTSNI